MAADGPPGAALGVEGDFVRALDARDPDRLAELFGLGATLEVPSGSQVGREEIRSYYAGRFAEVGPSLHFIDPAESGSAGPAEAGAWNFLAVVMPKDSDRAVRLQSGLYRFEQGDGGLIARLAVAVRQNLALPRALTGPLGDWVDGCLAEP